MQTVLQRTTVPQGVPRYATKGIKAPLAAISKPSRSRQARLFVQATSTGVPPKSSSDPLLQFSANIGLPTSEGLFGFRPFAEQWCGRLAMMGFITSIVTEFVTGKGTLAQIHLMDAGEPNFVVLALLLTVFGGATVAASVDTLKKIRNKELTAQDVARYKTFLALDKEGEAKRAAMEMKAKGDFTSLGVNMTQVNQSKADGAPVDAFLSKNEVQEGEVTARQIKAEEQAALEPALSPQGPAVSLAKRKDVEDSMQFGPNSELAYALNVEITNGRYAMLGFLTAVLVEAATGKGIIMQLIMWFKLTGFLGADSGF